jgi:hypothetical protein
VSKENPGEYIYRHAECEAGSPRWLKYYREMSSFKGLFEGLNAENFSSARKESVGKLIVEERRKVLEKQISDRMLLTSAPTSRVVKEVIKQVVGKSRGFSIKKSRSSKRK